jgi:hypothetical protein
MYIGMTLEEFEIGFMRDMHPRELIQCYADPAN